MEQLCGHVIRLIHAPIHVYDNAGETVRIYANLNEQADVLEIDPPFKRQLLEMKNTEYPVFYFEGEQVVYGIVSSPEQVYVIGPCCIGNDSKKALELLINTHHMTEDNAYGLYTLSLLDFSEMVLMIFETLTDKSISVSELWMDNFVKDEGQLSLKKQVQHVFYTNQNQSMLHNPYSQEKREQDSIRTGNLDALNRSFKETYAGRLGRLAKDNLRNEKDLAIVLVTLASRSAIEGGILPEVAYSMSDANIQRIEEMKTEGEPLAFARLAEVEFCCLVRDEADGKNSNPIITHCKELVLKYLHAKITVKDLAEELDLHANYLSQLFYKEVGISLSDYIAKKKIEFAAQQLSYTDDSYASVAYAYAFVSQSHFGRVFKKWTGMTPGQYRATYGKK